jgi:hypothetical protein
MRHGRWAVSSVILATILVASAARAQNYEARRVNVSPYVGIFKFDDQELTDVTGVEVDAGPLLGARVGVALSRSWEVEGAYGYSLLSTEASQFEGSGDDVVLADLTAHLLYGAVNYSLAYRDNPTELLLMAGFGLLILDPETDVGDNATDPMLELAVGFTHPVRDWIFIRGDLRDHLTFCSAADEAGEGTACPGSDEMLHNLEVSAALQFWVY